MTRTAPAPAATRTTQPHAPKATSKPLHENNGAGHHQVSNHQIEELSNQVTIYLR